MRKRGEQQFPQNKKPRFPVPDGFTRLPGTSTNPPPQAPQARRVPNFRSDFTLPRASSSDLPHPGPSNKQKQIPRIRPLHVVDLDRLAHDCRPVTVPSNDRLRSRSSQDALVPIENVPALGSIRVFSPPLLPLPLQRPSSSTKILEPPRLSSPPPRPCTPPKDLAAPDLSRFLSASHDPPRPSKPVSRTRIALATDLWTEGGRADVLALTLGQHGVQYATPMEKAVRRGLEVSPRKTGIGKEIRYARGGLAEKASQVIGKKTTALSLWRKSNPSPESASMLVQIEEILDSPKPPPQRGGTNVLLRLTRCRARKGNASVLVLFSVPAHDVKVMATTALGVGRSVALWEPLLEVEKMGVYLCTRFVEL